MRHLIGTQSNNRQRKMGIHTQNASIEELQFLPKSHKSSGGDFCSAKKARRLFKNLTELRQNSDRRHSAVNTIEHCMGQQEMGGEHSNIMGVKRRSMKTVMTPTLGLNIYIFYKKNCTSLRISQKSGTI